MEAQEQVECHKNLITAVLLRAIADHQIKVRRLGVAEAMKEEPARWIMSDDERPFSFLWCCAVLGLPPERLRAVMNTIDLMKAARARLSERSMKLAA